MKRRKGGAYEIAGALILKRKLKRGNRVDRNIKVSWGLREKRRSFMRRDILSNVGEGGEFAAVLAKSTGVRGEPADIKEQKGRGRRRRTGKQKNERRTGEKRIVPRARLTGLRRGGGKRIRGAYRQKKDFTWGERRSKKTRGQETGRKLFLRRSASAGVYSCEHGLKCEEPHWVGALICRSDTEFEEGGRLAPGIGPALTGFTGRAHLRRGGLKGWHFADAWIMFYE